MSGERKLRLITMLNRRSFLSGILAAPAVVRAASLMPVRGIVMPVEQLVRALPVWPMGEIFDFDAYVAELAQYMTIPSEWLVNSSVA